MVNVIFFPLATESKIEEIKKRKIVDYNERPSTSKDKRFKFEHELDVVVSTPPTNFDFF